MNEYHVIGGLILLALTAGAWARGWRAWALVPGLVSVLIGFVVGLIIGNMPLSEEIQLVIFVSFAIVGLLSWIALIIMICAGRRDTGWPR